MKAVTELTPPPPPPPPPPSGRLGNNPDAQRFLRLASRVLLAVLLVPLLSFSALRAQGQVPISFDLSLIQPEKTTFESTVNGLTLNMATDDLWGGSTRPPGFQTNDGVYVHTREEGMEITFIFNQTVRLLNYTINNVNTIFPPSTGDIVRLSAGDESTDETNYSLGTYDFDNQFIVAANTPITLTSINPGGALGAGIAWSQISVTIIPEPATFALLLGGLAMAYSFCRRRFKRV